MQNDRPCDKCLHHTSGQCDTWKCEPQTSKDIEYKTRQQIAAEMELVNPLVVDISSSYKLFRKCLSIVKGDYFGKKN